MKVSKNSQIDRIGVQTVGNQFERAGYIFREQAISDYGIDAHVELVEGNNATGKLIALQIKSGSSWFKEEDSGGFIFRGDNEHLTYWLEHSLPVIIVLCDNENAQCYWQAITPENVIHTKKAWKIIVPKFQKINAGMNVDLKCLVNKLPVHKNYTICSTEDVSHGAAKRYSLRIILNREHTQAEIIALLKKATTEAVNCEYHRNDMTRNHWRNQPAHVVWLHIYPSAEDEKNNNFICQSEWFSEDLQQDFLPVSNGGEEISPNIRVCWNDNYIATSRVNAQYTITKEDFILQVMELSASISPIVKTAVIILSNYQNNNINFESLKTALRKNWHRINGIYNLANDMGWPPYECKEMSNKFQNLLAHAHNIYLPFSGMGKGFDKEQTIFNIKSQAGYYNNVLPEFEFELKKVQ